MDGIGWLGSRPMSDEELRRLANNVDAIRRLLGFLIVVVCAVGVVVARSAMA